ncbi:tetratricopeptide repeat protein [Lysobacter korlensis]|uniref:Tetratricopeptide repeat protein n=1 Tax=Lysobacter korlensis TaxID=553636 RepID=A0ABV6RJX8_9GAMM
MPLPTDSAIPRLGLTLAVALALSACSSDEPEQSMAESDTGRTPHVIDKVVVRPPWESGEEPGIDEAPAATTTAEQEAVLVGEEPEPALVEDALPQPEERPSTAVVMEPPSPPPAQPAPRPAEPVRGEPAPATATAAAPRPVEPMRAEPAQAPRAEPSRPDTPRTAATARDPMQARSLNQEGIALINSDRPDQAIVSLERAVALQPRDPEILGNLGYAYMLAGEHDKASSQFQRSLDIAPTRAATWLNLGQTYAELGKREMAVDAVVTGYRHSTRKQSVRSALLAAATGRKYSPAWREAAGLALARIGDG